MSSRSMSSKKVAVLGANGGIGQPLSLLLKLSPEVDELACYDVVGTPGVAADLSHVRGTCLLVCLLASSNRHWQMIACTQRSGAVRKGSDPVLKVDNASRRNFWSLSTHFFSEDSIGHLLL